MRRWVTGKQLLATPAAWQAVSSGYRWGMGKRTNYFAAGVTFLLALCGCGTSRIEQWDAATRTRQLSLKPGKDLLGVTVPVLRSRGLEQVWGPPEIRRDASGGYSFTYIDPRQPASRLIIHGMTEPLPRLGSPPKLAGEEMPNNTLSGFERDQSWRTATIAGEKVRWFQESPPAATSGAGFSSEGFSLKTPDGRKGYYRLTAETTGDAPESVARWFGSVTF